MEPETEQLLQALAGAFVLNNGIDFDGWLVEEEDDRIVFGIQFTNNNTKERCYASIPSRAMQRLNLSQLLSFLLTNFGAQMQARRVN